MVKSAPLDAELLLQLMQVAIISQTSADMVTFVSTETAQTETLLDVTELLQLLAALTKSATKVLALLPSVFPLVQLALLMLLALVALIATTEFALPLKVDRVPSELPIPATGMKFANATETVETLELAHTQYLRIQPQSQIC